MVEITFKAESFQACSEKFYAHCRTHLDQSFEVVGSGFKKIEGKTEYFIDVEGTAK